MSAPSQPRSIHVPTLATPNQDGAREPGGLTSDDRKATAAVRAGVLAYYVDMYDIYLPLLTLLRAAACFQSQNLSAGTASILSAAVFVSTLLARPLGSAVFGHFADTRGRKKTGHVSLPSVGDTATVRRQPTDHFP
jgi:hypothetical protein